MIEEPAIQKFSTQACMCVYCRQPIPKDEPRVTFFDTAYGGQRRKVHAHTLCARPRILELYRQFDHFVKVMEWDQ